MQVMCMYGMIGFAMDEMIVLMVKMKNNAILVSSFFGMLLLHESTKCMIHLAVLDTTLL